MKKHLKYLGAIFVEGWIKLPITGVLLLLLGLGMLLITPLGPVISHVLAIYNTKLKQRQSEMTEDLAKATQTIVENMKEGETITDLQVHVQELLKKKEENNGSAPEKENA